MNESTDRRNSCAPTRMVVLAALILYVASASGVIIPPDRLITWSSDTVGVPGGIPNRTNIYTTISAGAMTVNNINNAIANCPSNRVILLAGGTYNMAGNITFGAGNNGITLRGSNTVLTFSAGNYINFGPQSWPFWPNAYALASGYTKGGSNLVLSTSSQASNFSVGQMCMVDELDDTNLVWGVSTGDRGRRISFVTVVTAINGGTITIWPPLPWSFYATNSPNINLMGAPSGTQLTMSGVENLIINKGGDASTGILMTDANGCWLKNVSVTNCDSYTVNIEDCTRCTFTRLDLRFSPHHTSNHAGINFAGRVSASQVEDSIFYQENNAISVGDGGQAGCCGNVFLYNFVLDSFQDSFGQYNGLWANHSAHNLMNLWEGNYANGIISDGYYGSSSHNTVFRNVLTGWTPTYPTSNSRCVMLKRWSLYWNVVGNILGTNTVATKYEVTASDDGSACIWQLGYPNIGNETYTGTRPPNQPVNPGDDQSRDLNVGSSLIRHGNWDVINRAIVWSTNIADRVLPSSYIYTGKPAYFNSLNWPPYDPNVTTASGVSPTNIPAGFRFIYGVDPPLGSTGNQPPVVVASATPTNGAAPLVVAFSSAGSYDPEGAALSYTWTFGDGSNSTTANPAHTYQSLGTYSATLSVSDGTNTSTSGNITINVTVPGSNQPPVAVATAIPTNGAAPLAVAFSSAGSYDPEGATLTYNWTFGDGTNSTAANPSHTYAAGTFTAKLQVSDGTNITSSSPLTITATNPPASVLLTSPTNGTSYAAPATIHLAASVTPNGHTITQVQFYNGTTLLGQDAATPYTLNWTNVGAGSYSLTARVVYDAGATAVSPAATIGVGGLVAAYGFEEGSGSIVGDTSANGNTGTISSATWAHGYFGNALFFNGSNAVVTVSDSPSLELATGMTLEAWVNPNALSSGDANIIFKDPWDYALGTSGSLPDVSGSSFTGPLTGPTPLPTNTWTHLAASFDGATLRLYVNGALVASQAQTGLIPTAAGALMIGGNASVSGKSWSGLIDEVRIYSRPLSATEIQADMNTPVVVRPLPPTGLHVVGP